MAPPFRPTAIRPIPVPAAAKQPSGVDQFGMPIPKQPVAVNRPGRVPARPAPPPTVTRTNIVSVKGPGDASGYLPPKTAPAPKALKVPAKLAQLPSTSGKTTVPTRTVTPAPAPPPKAGKTAPVTPKVPARTPAAVKPAAPAATPQLSPEDQATQAVTAALAPLYAAQGTQATGQNAAITNLTRAIIAQLQPGAAQVGGQYDQAIGQQTNLSNNAADALRAANPNTQDQALLSAINAPQAQQDQLAGQNNAAFNGGAAVGQYVGGVLPMSSLQSQKIAAVGMANQQPAIEGLRGQQSLSAALTNQAAERAKIDAMKPDLIQKYTAADVAAQQKQDYLDMAAAKFGYQQTKDARTQAISIAKFNAGVTAKNNKIDVTVSKSIPGGIARNSNGDPIIRSGKVITINANGSTTAKVPTASQINTFITQWKAGKTQSVTTIAKDANGNTVYDANGAPKTTTQTVQGTKPLGYGQAYRRLRLMRLSDTQARGYLDTAYARGEQGRAWVTNREQSVLSKAGLPPRARVLTKADGTKVGVLTGAQYHALTKAGLQVPAVPTSDGVWVIQQVN